MEHLTFDEIVNAIYAEEYTPENARLVAKVNSHVMNCPECDKIHKAVYEIYELGFEEGLDVVNERLRELKAAEIYKNDVESATEKHIMEMAIDIIDTHKIVLESIKRLSSICYYFSYPMSIADRGGDSQLDTTKLIDDENIDNTIEYSNGLLRIQLSKSDFDENKLAYPSIEIISDNNVLYDGVMDEEDELLYKSFNINKTGRIIINLKEQNG